ncbi:6,7-dimethyl-8-ribityllumazine synthase [Candidatus Anstonella stagnisolia]|nr:6,7-dimethyl-8-ribityllumazine synthase [Candidatus Anstonella stagnisolia]
MGIAIVSSLFNEEITNEMRKSTKATARKLKAKISCEYAVPGVCDIPFALQKAFKRRDVQAAVVLGAVVKGETEHDRLIAEVAAHKCVGLSLKYEKPVGFGIIGPGATWAKARKRGKEYGERAMCAAVEMCKL